MNLRGRSKFFKGPSILLFNLYRGKKRREKKREEMNERREESRRCSVTQRPDSLAKHRIGVKGTILRHRSRRNNGNAKVPWLESFKDILLEICMTT